jgi:ADP-heptose:LPS heptosyltransferase
MTAPRQEAPVSLDAGGFTTRATIDHGPERPADVLAAARAIALVRLDNAGDVILLSAAARELRAAAPRARLTLLATPAGAQAAALVPWLDETIVHRPVWQDIGRDPSIGPLTERRFISALAARRLDAALVFTSFSQSADAAGYACLLAGIPFRAGFRTGFAGRVLDPAVPSPDPTLQQAERNLRLLEGLGIAIADRRTAIRIPDAAVRRTDDLLHDVGLNDRPFVVLAPGASAASRRAPLGRLVEVAQGVVDAGLGVAVVGSTRERALAAPIATRRGVVDLTGRTGLSELAGVIARARVAVTMNSASLHLADALGTPLVVLYSGTDLESQWAPRQVPATVLRRPTDCSPCYRFDCPYDVACLQVEPERVVDAVLEHADLRTPKTPRGRRETSWIASAS